MSRTLIDVLNEGNPNKVGDGAKAVGLGNALKELGGSLRLTVASNIAVLPEWAKALVVLRAYASAGTSTGAKTPVAGAPSAGECQIGPTGNINFNATDAVTEVELTFLPVEGPIVDLITAAGAGGAVSTAALGNRKVRVLLEAEQLDGAAPGAKTVAARAATPSAGQACVTAAGAIAFNAEAADDRVRVKFIAWPASTVLEKLGGSVDF